MSVVLTLQPQTLGVNRPYVDNWGVLCGNNRKAFRDAIKHFWRMRLAKYTVEIIWFATFF